MILIRHDYLRLCFPELPIESMTKVQSIKIMCKESPYKHIRMSTIPNYSLFSVRITYCVGKFLGGSSLISIKTWPRFLVNCWSRSQRSGITQIFTIVIIVINVSCFTKLTLSLTGRSTIPHCVYVWFHNPSNLAEKQ